MSIAEAILNEYPELDDAQRAIIAHDEGPLLVIAGPGSGKTFSLVLRVMNLLVLGKAKPRELVICTFTEKSAFELRDRISAAARKILYAGDLSELRASTIHGLCNNILTKYRHKTLLGSNYETLDDLTQLLFIFDHFSEIVGPSTDGMFFGKWKTKWTTIEGLCVYFNKISEEIVDASQLAQSSNEFLANVGKAYLAYEKALFNGNRLDFAHQQKLTYELLCNTDTAEIITKGIKYIMVDEYQDTNYVQEQLLMKLSGVNHNLCVIGDEDQSLYRFRGATVRNILEFSSKVTCDTVTLTTNYRSHRRIVQAYDQWMASADWHNPNGPSFRYPKTIEADPKANPQDYPAVFAVWGTSTSDEAERIGDMISFLKVNNVIDDYSQIAVLLHSVREEHSGSYIRALESKGIPVFCPRARAYFQNEEVRLMVGCYAVIFGYYGAGRGNITGSLEDLADYVDECIVALAQSGTSDPLVRNLREHALAVQGLNPGDALDMRPADYFYRLLAFQPFAGFVKDENRARNLAIFSQLLNTFQNYYHYTVVTYRNREFLRFHLFNSFLQLLFQGGINEYEDPDQPFPKGHVQIMTIHQAKGLEFLVVVVGSLDKQISVSKQVDRDLQPYYHQAPFEPEQRVTLFDRMRLHYVAFSRPQKVLVLTSHSEPKDYFAKIWQGLPQWPYIQKDLLAAQSFELRERMPVKRSFSFSGDLRIYETCPRQYQIFREYDFTPSRSAVIFFGLLVHQTIEETHRIALDGKFDTLDESVIRNIFERTFFFLSLSDVRPVGKIAKNAALTQVLNYFKQNQEEMKRIIETEVDVSVEKDDYILTGKVDLLMGLDGRLELLDFKTAPRPRNSQHLLTGYERQLCTYAYILEKRHGKRPDRLLLYWTSEEEKRDALMEFPYQPEMVAAAGEQFDQVVRKIKNKDFRITSKPEASICKECDIRYYCGLEGASS